MEDYCIQREKTTTCVIFDIYLLRNNMISRQIHSTILITKFYRYNYNKNNLKTNKLRVRSPILELFIDNFNTQVSI